MPRGAAFFGNSENPIYKRMWDFMKVYNFKDNAEGFQALKESRLQAIITTKMAIEYEWKKDKFCQMKCAGKGIQQQALAFAFPIGSKWTGPVTSILREHEEVKVIEEIKKRWLSSGCKMHTTNNKQFDMLYLSGLCIILVSGFILGVATLSLEHLFANCAKTRRLKMQRIESNTPAMSLEDLN